MIRLLKSSLAVSIASMFALFALAFLAVDGLRFLARVFALPEAKSKPQNVSDLLLKPEPKGLSVTIL